MSVENLKRSKPEQKMTERQSQISVYVIGLAHLPYAMLLQPKRFNQEQIDQVLADYESLFGISKEEKLAAAKRELVLSEAMGTQGILLFQKEDEFFDKELDRVLEICDELDDKEGSIPKLPEL